MNGCSSGVFAARAATDISMTAQMPGKTACMFGAFSMRNNVNQADQHYMSK
jgi:hypothetical protein